MNRPLNTISSLALLIASLLLTDSASAFELVIHKFGKAGDGAVPSSGFVIDAMGNLYGVTAEGGSAKAGTVYQLTPPVPPSGAWTETVLYSFTGNGSNGDGMRPVGDLVFDGFGNLYGVTNQGGAFGEGTVFELSPPSRPDGAWSQSVLYSFMGPDDGAGPSAGLIFDTAGNLYGTASAGGTADDGLVFELSPPMSQGNPWTEAVLYVFRGGDDGAEPVSSLVFDPQGNLYGTTFVGGGHFDCNNGLIDCGTVFELSPPSRSGDAWTEAVLHAFRSTDGQFPQAGLVINSSGALAGTASAGGPGSSGVVFGLQPTSQPGGGWSFKILYSFMGQTFLDGSGPLAELTLGNDSVLYGTTAGGGSANQGTVFRLTKAGCCSWSETFQSVGGNPSAGVILLNDALYGTSGGGGFHNKGTAYQVRH
jgi:uncharacterized repeat protein (TIGR03803 family)